MEMTNLATIDFSQVLVDAPTSPSPRDIAAGDVYLYIESGEPITFKDSDGKHCVIGSNKKGLVIRQNFTDVVYNGTDIEKAIDAVIELICL